MQNKKKQLREGFSTGACAAAASKAAALCLLGRDAKISSVELNFPDGKKRKLKIKEAFLINKTKARASVIKDAGDDPDVTHGAEIVAEVEIIEKHPAILGPTIEIKGGKGVGHVTKPGLSVKVGEPAINPVPKQMIKEALQSVLKNRYAKVLVTIIVPKGQELSKKTLNSRLGIVGGISILGTTGIVKPISEAAWCATISVSMDVAIAAGIDTICLSTGRSSEAAAMRRLCLKEEAFISMGDYVGFSLKEAAKRPFKTIYLACQWSKLVKMAMGWNQTHVRFGALEPKKACNFIEKEFGFFFSEKDINTVRQMLGIILKKDKSVVKKVCRFALNRLKSLLPEEKEIHLLLVSYEKEIIYEE